MIKPTKDVIARAGFYIARGPRHFKDIRNIFLPNTGEDKKRFYHLRAGPLALCHLVNPAQVIALRSQKVR